MKRRIQASPTGTGIGLFLANDHDCSIAIVVYPKLWNKNRGFKRVVWDSGNRHLSIALAEGEVVEIDAAPERLALLDVECKRFRNGLPRLVVPLVDGDEPDEQWSTPEVNPVIALQGIERLLGFVGLGSVVQSLSAFDLPQCGVPLLRPLLYFNFVEEVERVIRNARRDYRWVSEDTVGVQGRPDEVTLEVSRSTGWPIVKCLFQSFDRATDVLTAICSALEVIANDHLSGSCGITSAADIRLRAIRLRRMLLDVPTVTRAQGLVSLKRARQGQLRKEWVAALNIASGVLVPDAGISFGSGLSAVEIGVDTSRVWEVILISLLRRNGYEVFDGNSLHPSPVLVHRPWNGLGTTPPRPDLIVRVGKSWLILDAKYKSNNQSLAIEDLYQVFAYSHLADFEDGQPLNSVGLAYPVSDVVSVGRSEPFRRNRDGESHLTVFRVLFPSLSQCLKPWGTYLGEALMSLDGEDDSSLVALLG
jgi:5-methylcytosine-specific restriction endonuclease McrBC regulatory subunit McrC